LVVVAPCPIKSPLLQSHLGGNVEKFVGVVWFSRISFGCGDLRIVNEFYQLLFLLLCLQHGYDLLDPLGDFSSATNNTRSVH
jgi:hypothetical protein